jgi:hypothetical protein
MTHLFSCRAETPGGQYHENGHLASDTAVNVLEIRHDRTEPPPRRKFTDEFRAAAVRLATSSQTTIARTAR